jgi:hypothetical protein
MVRAHASARSAVDAMATEIRQIQQDPDRTRRILVITNRPLAYGDNVDNDGDGVVDEELFNGIDDDSDWTPAHDRHVQVGTYVERADFLARPDLGDDNVDEDCLFSADEISWVVPGSAGSLRITYRIDTFEGEKHVLVRASKLGNAPEVVEPVVFDVVSLDILAWNANAFIDANGPFETIIPYWVESWDSVPLINNPDRYVPGVNPPRFPDGTVIPTIEPFYLPPAVYLRVTVNAERVPLSEIPESDWPFGNRRLKTVSISTVVNLESAIQLPIYAEYVRR